LLNSCQCDGSVRYVHYNCLKHWLSQKMERKEVERDNCKVVSFTWRLFECELCKHAYPYTFKAKGRSYRLIDVVDQDLPQDPSASCLLLESLTFEKNSSRNVQLVMPKKVEGGDELSVLKMGRGHDCEVRVCDISVSRCHTLLKYNNRSSNFYLEDNLSKFGTLISAKERDVELLPNYTKAVQIGRTVISFTIKEEMPQDNEQPTEH
jgi:hypothetical protein